MRTLQDAWRWYEATREGLRRLRRLGGQYWDELPWGGRLGRDDRFRNLEGSTVEGDANLALGPLDDLAVLVLFSVFEAQVREQVAGEVSREAATLLHRSLRKAAEDALQRIEEGSFFQVLEPFKDTEAHLVEQANQVRRYRNWVAHGRRGTPPSPLDPRAVFERLDQFLDRAGLKAPPTGPPAEATP